MSVSNRIVFGELPNAADETPALHLQKKRAALGNEGRFGLG